MHMSNRIRIVTALVLLGLSLTAWADTQAGDVCTNAIYLGKDFHAEITEPGTYWYYGNTFDLPLAVEFTTSATAPKPEIELDFTCTPGYYRDPILARLFGDDEDSNIHLDMPHKPSLKSKPAEDGKICYHMSLGKTYRDLLLKEGIDYNVVAYVKVTYYSAGTMSMPPENQFSNCLDGYKFMHLGDTVHVHAGDDSRHIVLPYIQWQNDSIRFTWQGEKPITLAVATECDFDPQDNSNIKISNFWKNKTQPDTMKISSERLKAYIENGEFPNEAGIFFGKWYSESDGILKVERVPMAPPAGGAKVLEYKKNISIKQSDTLSLYAIPANWTGATMFTTPTNYIFRMYVGTSPDFTPVTAVDSFQFDMTDDGHRLKLFTEDMDALWSKTDKDYLYVRFRCNTPTTLTPSKWKPNSCDSIAINLQAKQYSVDRKETTKYRFYYPDWKRGNITFGWTSTSTSYKCYVYIANTCTASASTTDPNTLKYKNLNKGGTWTITPEDMETWKDKVDNDGYVYVRFYAANGPGKMTITSTAPAEEDPEFVFVESIELMSDVEAITESTPIATITATVLPSNATIPTLKWRLPEGGGLVIWNRQNILEIGEEDKYGQVTIRAEATDGSGVFGTLSLMVGNEPTPTALDDIFNPTEDHTRLVIRNGMMLVEVNRSGTRTYYDMTGRQIQ